MARDIDPFRAEGSPGSGITPRYLSPEPLATEGEATPGPDDFNPFEEREAIRARERVQRTAPGKLDIDNSEGPDNVDIDGPGGVPPLFGDRPDEDTELGFFGI